MSQGSAALRRILNEAIPSDNNYSDGTIKLIGDLVEASLGEKSTPGWSVIGGDSFFFAGDMKFRLEPGWYLPMVNNQGPHLVRHYPDMDESYVFDNSINQSVLDDLEKFISRADEYKTHNFAHKRGYLLHGPQGSGKTSIVGQMADYIIKRDGIVLNIPVEGITPAIALMKFVKRIEPNKLIVAILEDVDAMMDDRGYESEVLNLLDGSMQVSGAVYIATTNYPEKLPPRISSRPRRFDKRVEVGFPPESVRKQYIKKKIDGIDDVELDRLSKLTEGYSFAAIAEFIISTKCLGLTEDETVSNLNEIKKMNLSSEKYEKSKKMGFNV